MEYVTIEHHTYYIYGKHAGKCFDENGKEGKYSILELLKRHRELICKKAIKAAAAQLALQQESFPIYPTAYWATKSVCKPRRWIDGLLIKVANLYIG